MLVLSANSMKSKAFDTLHKSLMYNKNNTRPKIDPLGTLHLMTFNVLREGIIFIHSSVQTEFYKKDNS